jgi:AcrR family transcriptional regulator
MAATRALLISDGYDQVTIDAIAREAGVSRPTVYRRWPSKSHVAFEAAFGNPDEHPIPQSSGDVITDLRQFISGATEFWSDSVVQSAALGVLADRRRDPQLHIRTQQLLDEQTRHAFTDIARRGIAEGVLRDDLEIDTLYDLLVGSTFYAVQVQHRTDIEVLVDQLCSLVLRGATRKESK